MMATTHALVGAAVASVALAGRPELAPLAVAAALAGGLFPDLDLYRGHRRTLHFPVYYTVAALPALGLAVLAPGPATVAVAAFVGSVALHSLMDVLGGGLELRPWEATSERAVFSHYHGRWIAPKRWIRYDGAPEDLLVAVLVSVPSLTLTTGPLRGVVAGLLAISAAYVLLRRPLAALAPRVAAILPIWVQPYVPDRYDSTGRDAS